MKELFTEHFTDLLVTTLIVFFTFITLHVLHLKTAGDDGFKWAAGIVGTLVGALLMRMKGTAANGNTPH